jgi:hypothetical protein
MRDRSLPNRRRDLRRCSQPRPSRRSGSEFCSVYEYHTGYSTRATRTDRLRPTAPGTGRHLSSETVAPDRGRRSTLPPRCCCAGPSSGHPDHPEVGPPGADRRERPSSTSGSAQDIAELGALDRTGGTDRARTRMVALTARSSLPGQSRQSLRATRPANLVASTDPPPPARPRRRRSPPRARNRLPATRKRVKGIYGRVRARRRHADAGDAERDLRRRPSGLQLVREQARLARDLSARYSTAPSPDAQ